MKRIKKVLITVPYPEEKYAVLREALGDAEITKCSMDDDAVIRKSLQDADVAILGGDLDQRFLEAPCLKWIHCDHAGLNRSAKPEIFEKGILLTSSAGRSAPALAEHAIFFMLALSFHFLDFYHAQTQHQWGIPGQDSLRALYGKTLGILGMGNTGRALALLASAFHMRVLGYSRDSQPLPEGFDHQYIVEEGETCDDLLRQSDFVVLAIPLCDATHHLIGERELSLMKQEAFLINMARGAIVDEKALVDALYSGTIAGAGLDTFETEPLSKESPLWDAPHTLITPHVTPQVPDRTDRSLEIICENIRRYEEGEPMRNCVTEKEIYTKGV